VVLVLITLCLMSVHILKKMYGKKFLDLRLQRGVVVHCLSLALKVITGFLGCMMMLKSIAIGLGGNFLLVLILLYRLKNLMLLSVR